MAAPKTRKKTAPRIPLIPLRSTTVYPLGVIGVQIAMPSTLEMLAANEDPNLTIAVVLAPGGPDDPIDLKSLEKIAVSARVSDRLNLPSGTVQATMQGIERVLLSDVREADGYFTAAFESAEEIPADEEIAQNLIARILNSLEALAAEVERIPLEVPRILRLNLGDPGRFADLVATLANFSVPSKDAIVQRLDVSERLSFACNELEDQLVKFRPRIDATEPDPSIPAIPIGPAQRTADLRQRIKLMQAELGDIDPVEREVIEALRRIETADLPMRATATARVEIERLRSVQSAGPEGSDIRSYVDWITHVPWRERTAPDPQEIDLTHVEEVLDESLLGLNEQKDRLLDHLAVAKLRGDLHGPIPCIVGPPDVGKTALVIALARGLGRPLARLELGSYGEPQLVGTRRTRAGATPGKIISALRDVGARDPVFLLEEMDEIGLGKVEGDPVEAMEEVLDWESRENFVDRYLDIPFDLTDVLFIATAQDFYRVPRDLRELMVEIRIAGYTPEEKVEIAEHRLIPKLLDEHGLERGIKFPRASLTYLAYGYARDAGMGAMRRALETILRTRARARTQGDTSTWMVDPTRIEEILGLPRYTPTPAESSPEIGVVTGLAWTAAGGELMFIEALRMPGTGRLIITGMLGEVMRESVNAAYSYVRSRSESLGISDDEFRTSDVHVHFPVGAIPKDGPSAGIAVTLAIASALSNRAVRHDIAMTGEVTLRGKVLEIGGVKEKVLAAHRAGIRDIILPAGNERDLRDVPADVREHIHFHFVDRMDDVVRLALLGQKPMKRKASPRKTSITAEPRAAKKK